MILKSLFLLFCSITAGFCGTAPVLLWGSPKDVKPFLSTISSPEFGENISEKLKDSMVVIFLEKSLKTEDLSLCEIYPGKSCYTYLAQVNPKSYYASVEEPVETARKVGEKKEYVRVNIGGELENEIKFEPGKVVLISFDDAEGLERPAKLHGHDAIISKIYKDLSTQGPIVALYTSSETQTLSRKVRQAQEPQKGNLLTFDKNFLLYFDKIEVQDDGKTTEIVISGHSSTKTATGLDIALNGGDNKITFKIDNLENEYWQLSNLKWNDNEIKLTPNVVVPSELSYYCGPGFVFTNDKKTLNWTGVQMEAFFPDSTAEHMSFGEPWHCVGFTSPGIWAGIFVTFLLLFILSIGISWLMDIKTMDRFDDPKGKTITINALE